MQSEPPGQLRLQISSSAYGLALLPFFPQLFPAIPNIQASFLAYFSISSTPDVWNQTSYTILMSSSTILLPLTPPPQKKKKKTTKRTQITHPQKKKNKTKMIENHLASTTNFRRTQEPERIYLYNETSDGDTIRLSNPMDPHHSLFFHSWIPPWILQRNDHQIKGNYRTILSGINKHTIKE